MQSYKFNLNEGSTTASLTVKANDEQSAIEQAQSLLKSSDSIGQPEQVSEESETQA